MGRAPCCDKANVKKGPWSPEEDTKLKNFIEKNGTGGNWIALPHKAGLKRCGKSCRLRWLNYLRPNIKHGEFSDDEDRIICNLFATIGSRWSIIAAQLPGRTDNDIKNYWNTKLKKKLMGFIPSTSSNLHPKIPPSSSSHPQTSSISFNGNTSYNPTNFSSSSFMGFLTEHMSKLSSNHHFLNNNYTSANTFMLGGAGTDQQSCSSSDGSCNHISYGKESIVNGVGTFNIYHETALTAEETQKFEHGWIAEDQKQNGFLGNHHQNIHNQDYSDHGYGTSDVNLFFSDENKTEVTGGGGKEVMYYY